MPLFHLCLGVLTILLWGLNFGFSKWTLAELPPIWFMTLRFALVAVLLVPFVKIPWGRFKWIAAVSVTLGLLHFSMLQSGFRVIDASTTAIALQLQVPFAAILAAIYFKDKLGWRRMLGMMVAFAGVVVVAGAPTITVDKLPSLLLIIGASFMWAISNVIIKKMGTIDAFQLNGWMAVLATPQLALASFFLESDQIAKTLELSWYGIAGIVYNSVVVVIIGYAIWYFLLKRYSVNQTMPLTLLLPFFGVLTGIFMLGETLTIEVLVGGLLTVAGVAVIVLRRPKAVETPAGSPT